MSYDAALAVLHYYFPSGHSVRKIESIGNAGGWSGSRLWRISAVGNALRGVPGPTNDLDLCLRRWPREHPTRERLEFMHRTLETVSAAGIAYIPVPLRTLTGKSYIEHAGHFSELTRWLPGSADFHAHPSRERLRAAMQALARFHAATAANAPSAPAPAIAERVHRTSELRSLLDRLSAAVQAGLDADLDARARRILSLAPQHLSALLPPLQFAAAQLLLLQPAIRDIHHDHVLFTGDEVTGLIDFGALRIDTPLTDVARLVGSLVGDDLPAREFALAAYAELRPLSEADRRLIDLLDYSGVVLGSLNWLVWLYLERRDMGETAPVIKRLDEIVGRLAVTKLGHGVLG